MAEETYNISDIHNRYKKFKYLGINLTEHMKELYNEISERNRSRQKHGKNLPYSQNGRISVLYTKIYRFNVISINTLKRFSDLE